MTHFLKTIACSALLLAAGCGTPQATPLPAPKLDEAKAIAGAAPATIVLAGGCFWGVEGVFEHVRGVRTAVAGYAGGAADTATYEQVSTGTTGHAEAVAVTYDPAQVTLGQLLQVYFSVATDPTEVNRQGPDSGTQYRGTIFTATPEQQKVAQAYIAQLAAAHSFDAPLATQVTPLPNGLKDFYPAEAHHQHFLRDNPDYPYIVVNDAPKVAALQATFPALYQ